MKRALFLGLTLSFSSFAAGVPATSRRGDDLASVRSKVLEFGARLTSLEKELGSKNNLYLSSITQIKQFESDVKLYRDKLKDVRRDVTVAQADNKKIIQSYLVESENEATEVWQRRVHFELLKQAQATLKAKEIELASFEAKVTEFDSKLVALKKNEEELSQVIAELEARKKSAMESYQASVNEKKKVETVVQKKVVNTKLAEVRKEFSKAPIVQERPDRFFGRPVDDYMAFTASPKGVTFKYQAVQPIKAVGEGKIVFAGDLSNYGQVVLIDHGKDLRTVLLGKMNIKVKKNDTVKPGEVLAYTVNDTKDAQNLYFEVRKKNTAQNTILWLDQNGVSKI